MAATPLDKILGKSDALTRLQDHARRLHRLQRVVNRCMPPNLRGLVAVANISEGTLTLHVPTPALATRIKMSGETIKQDLLAQGELVDTIQTRVRATHTAIGNQREKPARRIGNSGREALDDLRRKLEADDPLAQALKRMLERSR